MKGEEKVTTGPRRSKEGLLLALILWFIVIGAVVLFAKRFWWFPPLASNRVGIDDLFFTILVVTGITFVLVQSVVGYLVWRYSDQSRERAIYWYENLPLEIIWTLVTAAILATLILPGLRLWAQIYSAPPLDSLRVEVTGQQFEWNIRYPGKDGIFGRIDSHLITSDNPLGLDENDPTSKDDIVLLNQLYLPLFKPVAIRLRSKDMVHSFFLPHFRVKQDTVPGLAIEIWFTPTRLGKYEIACAELCGLGHYRMRGFLQVMPLGEFEKWLENVRRN